MSDIGLMFDPKMIQAFLDGRKSLTRRTRGLGEINDNPDDWVAALYFSDGWWHFFKTQDAVHRHKPDMAIKCPFPVGARVYEKEAWATEKQYDHLKPKEIPRTATIFYVSDGVGEWPINLAIGKLRSSMFMPKWAARIWQEIVGVRPERVQDITEADAKREGVMAVIASDETDYRSGYRAAFADLWDRLSGRKYPWAKKVWVWRLELKEVKP